MWNHKTPVSSQRARFEKEALIHLDALYAAALRLTHDPGDAEDLLQDAVLAAYRNFDSFSPGTRCKAWLFKILTNTFINKYRRTQKERSVFDGADADPVGEGVLSQATVRQLQDPTSIVDAGMFRERVREALDQLPEEYRMVVLLADVEEFSYREIADIVGCPIGTVMSRLHRGRQRMQQMLREDAVAMGLIHEEPSAETAQTSAPASLDEYRRRKVAR